ENAPQKLDKTEQFFTSETAAEPAAETVNLQTEPETAKDERTYVIDENKGGSFVSKFLTAWLLLILGGIVGAALYYFLSAQPQQQQAAQEPPKLTQMQTPNIEYSAFEDNRRNADKNPEQFIQASGATAQDAETLYLLGRAYFVTRDYVKAKDAFTKARERLSEVKEINRKTLENEIAIGLSIVENNIARSEFIKQKQIINSPPPTNPANTASPTGNQ
ncbi:MAG TPA: tetratricopeptide repeat protein, partial [Pyrinomonadaceae bacterium]|nr:tetratricopeptide repeat protein [Pyrinomonadaceae bacterium]